MSQIPRVSHGFLDRRNPNQVDPAWYVFLQQMAAGVNGIPAAIDSSGKQNFSPLLSEISEQTGSGFLVLQGGSGAVVRQLGEGEGISITNPSGGAGNPVISLEDLADSGIGDDGLVVLTRDDKGRIAGMAPATAEDLAFDDTVHGLALVNVQTALDAALGALPYFSDTAPDPSVHPYWIDTTDLTPYVWYDDGTSAQWIALDALASLAASAVTYDNTTSGLTATNVQDAIDEIAGGVSGSSYTRGATWSSRSAITVANARHIDVFFASAATITGVTILTQGGTGTCVIDIKKSAYPAFPPSSSICASAKPTVTSDTDSQDTTLTGWTTSIAAGDVLRFSIDSTSTFTDIALSLSLDPA